MVELSRQHGLALFMAWGALPLFWARARLHDRETGATELRRALAAYTDQGNRYFVPLFQGLLSELESEGQGAKEALAGIDEALALTQQTGEHWTDALLHRIGAQSCSSATRRTLRPPRKPSSPPSQSRANSERAASACKLRSGSPNSTNRPAAASTPTPSSRPRSKALRRRRKCQRSLRRRHCLQPLPEPRK